MLAAEEFVVPAPDPGLHVDQPHDVLAAEEFELGAADPALHHGRVTPPPDPSGIAEPHDVLAAEEFAVPAGRGGVRPAEAGAAGRLAPTGQRGTGRQQRRGETRAPGRRWRCAAHARTGALGPPACCCSARSWQVCGEGVAVN